MDGLRVTGGTLRGAKISTVKDSRVRYTSSKVRKAAFDLIGDVAGFKVLDLFAGSGSFTIEALSRGAGSVVCVEKERRMAALIKDNLARHSLDKDCVVLNMDVRYALRILAKRGEHFDLIFMDPPYEMGYIALTLQSCRENVVHKEGSLFLMEHSKREKVEILPGEGHQMRSKVYGDTVLSMIGCGGR